MTKRTAVVVSFYSAALVAAAIQRGVRRARKSEILNQSLVVRVTPDPEPGDLVFVQQPDRPVSDRHPSGVHRLAVVHLLELQALVPGIVGDESVRLACSFLDVARQVAQGVNRDVACDFTTSRDRWTSSGRPTSPLSPQPPACSGRLGCRGTASPIARRPEVIRHPCAASRVVAARLCVPSGSAVTEHRPPGRALQRCSESYRPISSSSRSALLRAAFATPTPRRAMSRSSTRRSSTASSRRSGMTRSTRRVRTRSSRRRIEGAEGQAEHRIRDSRGSP